MWPHERRQISRGGGGLKPRLEGGGGLKPGLEGGGGLKPRLDRGGGLKPRLEGGGWWVSGTMGDMHIGHSAVDALSMALCRRLVQSVALCEE